jgi:hypothetical protein
MSEMKGRRSINFWVFGRTCLAKILFIIPWRTEEEAKNLSSSNGGGGGFHVGLFPGIFHIVFLSFFEPKNGAKNDPKNAFHSQRETSY